MIRKFPFTTLLVLATFTVCMVPIPETPLSGVAFIDKWTHAALYFGLEAVYWAERGRAHLDSGGWRLFAAALAVAVIMGGVIELMQETLTACRSGDWMDFAADAIGALAGAALGRAAAWPLFARWGK